ncbi:MAG: ATP-binding cassette domain-containing protein, partial [Nakamurella sp.]
MTAPAHPFNPPGPTTATATPAVVRTDGLVKVYGHGDTAVRALDGVDIAYHRGSMTAIMGPSGSGKSTLMHCAAGLDSPTSGRVLLGGTDLTELGDRELTAIRRDRIGFIFQSFNL